MDETSDIDTDLGSRIKGLRSALTLSIEALAAQSGVSRAMISRIERGESSATAQLLARLAGALGVSLSTLFAAPRAEASPLARRADQPVWRDPASGYVRRAVSPATATGIVDLVEVELPPGALIPFERQAQGGFDQLVWLREGELAMSIDGENWALAPGDCLHMRLDRPLMFHNPGSVPAKYAVVLTHNRQATPR